VNPAQLTPLSAPEINYGALLPILIILGAACAAVLVEAFLPRHQRWPSQVALSLVSIAAAGIALGVHASSSTVDGLTAAGDTNAVTIAGALSVDRPTMFLWGTLLALGLGSILLIADRSVEPGGAFLPSAMERAAVGGRVSAASGDAEDRGYGSPDQAPTMQTEVFPFVLFALGGMMAFVAANDLLTMFIALEVLSLPLYLMCGLARRRRLLSQEAAVKYFLLGAFASAFFLYGLALMYGYAGSVRFSDIGSALATSPRSDALLFAGLALLVVGLMFKASVAPFHTWTPDVYQGAPTPVTAFMAACTKVAAFGGIARVLFVAFGDARWDWRPVLWGIAIISMVVGAVLGLTQTDVKRMIAYSSIAHAGFILLGAMSITAEGTSGTLFYLLAYGFTTLAVFGVISLVRDADGEATHLSQWAGLAKRSPVLAAVMTFLLLALAGIPLTSGFTAKFAVFGAAIGGGQTWLVIFGVITSMLLAFPYLRVVVLMWLSEPGESTPTVSIPGALTSAALAIGVIVTLALGVVPAPLIDLTNDAAQFVR
jgi:NADH-quinone oxidoreductase subunit N